MDLQSFWNPAKAEDQETFIQKTYTDSTVYYHDDDINKDTLLETLGLRGVFIFFDEENLNDPINKDVVLKIGENTVPLNAFDYFNPVPLFNTCDYQFVRNNEPVNVSANVCWIYTLVSYPINKQFYYPSIDKTIHFLTQTVTEGEQGQTIIEIVRYYNQQMKRVVVIDLNYAMSFADLIT